MTKFNPEIWNLVIEDPDALPPSAWAHLEQALSQNAALRRRLVAERQLHERLSRLHDAGRGDLGAALVHRLSHDADHTRFVRRVLQRTGRRRVRRSVLPLAAAALLLFAVGLSFWLFRPESDSHWIDGPARIALIGGGTVDLEHGSRWRNGAAPFLERGVASLEVAHRSTAAFVMRTPQATITVLGTQFSVHVDSETAVAVQRGRVRLENVGGTAIELSAGERGRTNGGVLLRERVLFTSDFSSDQSAVIVIGRVSAIDPQGKADACVSAGVYSSELGPRACVSVAAPNERPILYEPDLRLHFRWWAEPAVGIVLLQVWNEERKRNFMLELGRGDGTWKTADLSFSQLRPFAGLPEPERRAQPGDHLLGALLVGSAESGRLYLDDLVFSVPK